MKYEVSKRAPCSLQETSVLVGDIFSDKDVPYKSFLPEFIPLLLVSKSFRSNATSWKRNRLVNKCFFDIIICHSTETAQRFRPAICNVFAFSFMVSDSVVRPRPTDGNRCDIARLPVF